MYAYVRKLVESDDLKVRAAIAYKIKTLTTKEEEYYSAYINVVKEISDSRTTLACIAITIEAEKERDFRRQVESNMAYTGAEKIFTQWGMDCIRRKDLIDYRQLVRQKQSRIFNYKNRWGVIDGRISEDVLDWLDVCFKDNAAYVRVIPNAIYSEQPSNMLTEILIRPAQWGWWKELRVYNSTGSRYDLQADYSNAETAWDYYIRNVRSLQTVISRKGKQYLSMMIEELSDFREEIKDDHRFVIGRMIHLDTDAEIGVPFEKAMLMHIDLAVNMYVGDAADERLVQDLYDGTAHKVVDASYRTHILRIENIPFAELPKFVMAFMRSKYLVNEWLKGDFAA